MRVFAFPLVLGESVVSSRFVGLGRDGESLCTPPPHTLHIEIQRGGLSSQCSNLIFVSSAVFSQLHHFTIKKFYGAIWVWHNLNGSNFDLLRIEGIPEVLVWS